MWEELAVIADRLDKTGLFAEAHEIDVILSMAAMPGGPVFSQLEQLMNASGKDTFTREEINKLMEEANELGLQLGRQMWQKAQDKPAYIAESIKELTTVISEMLNAIKASSKDSKIYHTYIDYMMGLSNNLTILERMMSGARGPEDIEDARRIREMAGNYIDTAHKLVKEFYQVRLGNFNWAEKFSQIMDNWNKLKSKREEISKLMAQEQRDAELAGTKLDPRDSKHAYDLKSLDTFDNTIKKDAKEIMSYYDMMALVDPYGAKNLEKQLGNTFAEIKRIARESLRSD